jgi:hypothetical protein
VGLIHHRSGELADMRMFSAAMERALRSKRSLNNFQDDDAVEARVAAFAIASFDVGPRSGT